jgi:DNA-binding transcriptional regulator/RsmH inhibitor MraZ
MKKRAVSMLLTAVMAVTGMAATATVAHAEGEEGKVINIYSWNDEFRTRLEAIYPEVESTSSDGTVTTLKDGTEIHWIINPNQDGVYQQKLDEALLNQADASDDDKVDIFLTETDYVFKYTDKDADVAMPLTDLGIDPDTDLADQYDFTRTTASDSDGVQRGSTWQCCPGTLVYRRDIAKEVFGTDDPAEVQKKVADWDTFKATAEELKEKGYQMTSTVNDSYRVFSNNVSTPWVVDGKITVDNNIKNWVDMSKEMVDAGETATYELWSDDWSKGFFKDSNVFAYFGPAWFIDFSMSADQDGSVGKDGGWAATEGPQGFYWGGTWITAATGTDNPTLVADIMRTMTTNVDVMKEIVTADNDFINNKPAMEEMAADESYGDAVLGGQNPLAMFCAGADKIDLSNMSIYDQGCNEEFQNAMKNYFEGNATYEEALDLFYKAVVEKYPELSY